MKLKCSFSNITHKMLIVAVTYVAFLGLIGCNDVTTIANPSAALTPIASAVGQLTTGDEYMSQTIAAYTIDLQGTYYVGSRIVVYFAFTGYSGEGYLSYAAKLTDTDGNLYPTLEGIASNKEKGVDIVNITFSNVVYGKATISPLSLALDVYTTSVPRQRNSDGTQTVRLATNVRPFLKKERAERLAGTFNIEIGVSLFPLQRSIILAQSVKVNNVEITLERVNITPSFTIVYLRAAPKTSASLACDASSVALTIGDWGSLDSPKNKDITQQESWGVTLNCSFEHTYFTSLSGRDNVWVLVVDKLQFINKEEISKGYIPKTITGPWTFNFTVPPNP